MIEDLVKGEFMQLGTRDSAEERFVHYMSKTFKKTASLFAHSCQAVARLTSPRCSPVVERIAFEYGRNLGLAFQLMDDLLDFIAESSNIGKPVMADLKLGLATAPVLFAARQVSYNIIVTYSDISSPNKKILRIKNIYSNVVL